MTRNPHEIVTLDDQPESGQRYEAEPLEPNSPICPNCGRLLGMCTCKPDPRYIAKPMRIRYMELPGEINPNTNELTTPFVIVIDRAGNNYDGDFADIAIQTGARGTLLFRGEVQIGDDPE